MSIRLEVIEAEIEREGGDKFTDRAEDRGGPTRWGVTQATARQFGYSGSMADYPKAEAIKVNTAFWNQLGEVLARVKAINRMTGLGMPIRLPVN